MRVFTDCAGEPPRFSGSIAFVLLLCAACASASKPAPATVHVPATPPPPPVERKETGDVKVSGAADPLPVQCEAGASESCNALDDDCNGIIDDGCGYQTGAVQVTVAWDSGADIDLYVTDPSGETLYYNEKHAQTSIGGRLDQNARGDCRREQKQSRVENAYWPAPATPGVYRVELHYFGPCEKSSLTKAKVSVSVRGKLVGSYSYELKPEQRIEALSFEIK
jgi:hypothetical protein